MYYKNKAEVSVLKGKDKEYLIKDKYGINLGVFSIIELNKDNKFCCFKIKFYKNEKKHCEELKKALNLMVKSLFKKMDIVKINVVVEQDIMLSPFIDLGFVLEGILYDSIILNNERKSELIFGVDINTYKQDITTINILRFKGDNIELKVLTPKDSEDVLDYYIRNKEHLKPFEPTREENFYTLEVQMQNLMESYKQFLNGTSIEFGIYINKKFIGKIKLSNVVRGIFQNAFVGYSIDEKEQNKGYMKEALNIVLNYGFGDMELHRIEATTLLNNEKSQRVLKSCGFKEIGISKKYLFIDGKWRDHKIFSKTKE